MNCIVLAAGYATRLYPLTENFPKPLLEVGGKTIVDWLLDDLNRGGKIERCAVVSNAKFAEHFRQWRDAKQASETKFNAPIEIVDDGSTSNETRIGAVKDILFAMETLGWSGDTLVVAGDNVLSFSLNLFLDYFERKGKETPGANAAMRYFEPSVEKLRKCGVLEIGADDRVLSMEEKPAEPKSHWCAPPFYCYAGLTCDKIRAALADGCGFDAPGSLLAWTCKNEPTFAFETPGVRFDVGNLESYQKIKAEYKGYDA
ncbi:MAG: nucleotidyltransferase family protein [Thermoguttaceae bacterium]|nr:nucleotidyltransferase family protein [Thermoguttaceae bacterium]